MRLNLLIAFCFGQAILNLIFVYWISVLQKDLEFVNKDLYNEVDKVLLQIFKLRTKIEEKNSHND